MSENKREKVKITIEVPGEETKVIECHGVALTTLEDLGDKYNAGAAVIGKMCVNDLEILKHTAENELIESIDSSIESCMKKSLNSARDTFGGFLRSLLGLIEGE